MALTDTKVRSAKPEDNANPLSDGDGLFYWYMLMAPNIGDFVFALVASSM